MEQTQSPKKDPHRRNQRGRSAQNQMFPLPTIHVHSSVPPLSDFFTDREYHIICTIIVPSNMESSLKFASGGSAAKNNHPQKDQDTYRTGYLREYWQSNPAEKNKNYTHKAE